METNDETPGHVTNEKTRIMHRFRGHGIGFEVRRRRHFGVDALVQLHAVPFVTFDAEEDLQSVKNKRRCGTENDFEAKRKNAFEFDVQQRFDVEA